MDPAFLPPDTLTREEWELIVELADREVRTLYSEIHHASSRHAREELRHRLDLLDNLLRRCRPVEAVR